jgi:hypothetical protein
MAGAGQRPSIATDASLVAVSTAVSTFWPQPSSEIARMANPSAHPAMDLLLMFFPNDRNTKTFRSCAFYCDQ